MDENAGFPRAGHRRKLTITVDDLTPAGAQTIESRAATTASGAAPASDPVTVSLTSPGPLDPPTAPLHTTVVSAPPTPRPASTTRRFGPTPDTPVPRVGVNDTSMRPVPLSHERAGFWKRFWALWIDGVILVLPGIVLTALLSIVGVFLWSVAYIAYFTYFEGRERGQTPGKAALGIRVISRSSGGPISHSTAFGRQCARLLSGMVFDLGYLWMLWDPERQTWHDKLADTVVVPASLDRR